MPRAGCSPTARSSAILRDAHHIFAPAGTSDIQLLRLAEVALGTAKGEWSQRLSRTWCGWSPRSGPLRTGPHLDGPGGGGRDPRHGAGPAHGLVHASWFARTRDEPARPRPAALALAVVLVGSTAPGATGAGAGP